MSETNETLHGSELDLIKQFGLECAVSDAIAQKILGVDRVTLYRLRKTGKIGYHRIGSKKIVYSPAELRRFLDANEVKPKSARVTKTVSVGK